MTTEIISVNDDLLKEVSRRLFGFEKEIPKVVTRAINRSIQSAKTQVVKELRDEYNVKASTIRKTINLRRASYSDPYGVISSRGGLIPLINFKVRPGSINPRRRTPITAYVKKGSGGSLGSAFIARMGGHKGVYERRFSSRLPVRELQGPAVPQMMGSDQMVKEISARASETLEKRLDHEINRVLDGAR